jgi:hypothetical protein
MNKLIEIRNQELMCRERALDEIASHFGADDGASFMGAAMKTASNDGARV